MDLNPEVEVLGETIGISKPRTISERLSEAARISFVGRKEELALLSDAIQASELPFVVAFIHGPGGIGKSRLVQTTLSSVTPEVRSHVMDCREIEPTPEGFQMALAAQLEIQGSQPDLNEIVNRLRENAERTVVALDTYETFGLMDAWLRQVFVPALSENTLTIISGRQPPSAGWLTTPGWQGLFREIELQELSAKDATKMLESRGLASDQVARVKRFARGYPLALEMAAAAIASQPDLEINAGPPPKILQQLTHAFLAGLSPNTTEAVEATSAVRRITEPLLKALLPGSNTRELFDHIQALPFIDATAEGLIFHDVVRDTIFRDLARRDPDRYATFRRRAWRYFSEKSHHTASHGLWQYTADLLYMIENPVVRDAFFPEGATDIRVEPATASDGAGILDIAKISEPHESIRLIERWWNKHPETFNIAKTQKGDLAAFYIIFEPDSVDRTLLDEDPFTYVWLQHLRENPVADGERVLFCRRWLDRTTGEAPSPAVGACFLDMKRFYMELRPSLRRIYFPVKDISIFEPILFPLGFGSLEGANVVVNGIRYCTLMNDFGPSSVDGWLAKVIGAELGVDSTRSEHGRILTTVLFTDIVSSTERAVELGDSRWGNLIERHHALVRSELAKFGGREIDTAGDGFFAIFDSPAQAVQCASSIRDSVAQLGIHIRAGLHLGECEATGEAVRGIAVHVGARVAAKAGVGEVWVSKTVKDVVAGSGIRFGDRGTHTLKGIPGEWPLFAVERGGAI